MSSIEQQILQHIAKLDPENQRRVLDFVIQLENYPSLSAQEVMNLPIKERQQYVLAAIESASNEDFETFEAYAEESLPNE
jgi:hypothetical protein